MDMKGIGAGLRGLSACALLLLLTACATNRSYVSLAVPTSAATGQGDKVAVIGEINDRREFQENPSDPSIPSLKKGAEYALDAEGRKSSIARKRNGYGKAIGDIQLQPPQTVISITRQLVADGLQKRGYRVLGEGEAAPGDALRVDVDIREFWAWVTPGFWSIGLEAKINTLLKFGGAHSGEAAVAAYTEKRVQTGAESNWKETYDQAFHDYLQKQQAALQAAGL